MTAFKKLALVGCACFLIPACGGSKDKLMKDQIACMNDISAIVENVANGSLSPADAAKKVKKWDEEGERIRRRKLLLFDSATPAELKAVTEKHEKAAMEAAARRMGAMQKLQQSGRASRELTDAVIRIGNP